MGDPGGSTTKGVPCDVRVTELLCGTGVSDAQSGICQNPQERREGELYCVQILLIKKQDASGSCEEEG